MSNMHLVNNTSSIAAVILKQTELYWERKNNELQHMLGKGRYSQILVTIQTLPSRGAAWGSALTTAIPVLFMPHCSRLVEVSTLPAMQVWAPPHPSQRNCFLWHNRKVVAKILALAFDLSKSTPSSTCLGVTSLQRHTGSTDTLAGNTPKPNPGNQTESTDALHCTFDPVLFTVSVSLYHCESTGEGFRTWKYG